MSQPRAHRAAWQKRRLSIVSEVIDRGSNAYVGILRDSPSCVLKWPIPNDDDALESFQREQRVLAVLGQHQYIAQFLWASERGLCFEYHPFRSLRHYYQQNGLPPLDQRLRWCHQAVSGFAYIHSKNIVHQDISVRNLLCSSNLDIKICDFGSATVLGEVVHGLAEFRYSGGRSASQATFTYDLFCIGALFYEIILGKPPYDGLEREQVVQRYAEHKFPSLEDINPAYALIIEKCWHDEYTSIQELACDLPQLPVILCKTRADLE